jgi:hypothetical protein
MQLLLLLLLLAALGSVDCCARRRGNGHGGEQQRLPTLSPSHALSSRLRVSPCCVSQLVAGGHAFDPRAAVRAVLAVDMQCPGKVRPLKRRDTFMKGPFCPGQTGAARGTRFQSPVSRFQFAAGLSKTGQTRGASALS